MARLAANFIIGWLWLALAPVAWGAQPDLPPSGADTRKALVAVVQTQLEAFRAGDIEAAYSLASRALRRQRPLRAFATIIEEYYPEIWANTRVEFGLARDDDHRARLNVVVYAGDERAAYDFLLVRERVGWRIEGVLPRAARKENVL